MNPGQYNLIALQMTAENRIIDISNIATRVDIYENIMYPGIIAEIVINDSTGVTSSFINEEFFISFTTNEDGEPIKYKFKTLQVDNGTTSENDKSAIYKITCISEELYRSKTIKNIPLVRSKDVDIIDAVGTMMKILKTDKKVFAEKTNGLYSISSANMTPFEFIDILRKQAVSAQYKGSAFVFFENKYGFNFKSLEKLIEEGVKNIGDKIFYMINNVDMDVTGTKWRNILGSRQIQVGNDNVSGLIGGNLNRSTAFDCQTGVIDYFNKPPTSFETISMNNGSSSINTETLDKYAANEGLLSFHLIDAEVDKNQVPEKNNYLPYYMSQFLNVIQHITIYGDSEITVGDIIKVNYPKRTGFTDGGDSFQNGEDRILSGNYLVCKVRHTLSINKDCPLYFQSLEIIKDGIGGEQLVINKV